MSNVLVGSLDREVAALMAPHLASVVVGAGQPLVSPDGDPAVWFPETCVAAVRDVLPDGRAADVGMIGREGMIGWPLLLGAGDDRHDATVLLDGGTALRMSGEFLLDLCARSRPLHAALLRFVRSYTVQLGQSVAAGLRDGVDARLARLLLMLHDRVAGDDLPVTHGELSSALNVRRASVTDCLHILEGDRLVRCTRGRLQVRDRAGLRAVAGPSYGAAESSYTRLVAPFGKG